MFEKVDTDATTRGGEALMEPELDGVGTSLALRVQGGAR